MTADLVDDGRDHLRSGRTAEITEMEAHVAVVCGAGHEQVLNHLRQAVDLRRVRRGFQLLEQLPMIGGQQIYRPGRRLNHVSRRCGDEAGALLLSQLAQILDDHQGALADGEALDLGTLVPGRLIAPERGPNFAAVIGLSVTRSPGDDLGHRIGALEVV